MADAPGLDEREQVLVREAAQRAAAQFPWYAEMLGRAGEVPILREADLATTYYGTDHERSDAPDGQLFLTSGTASGDRKSVLWSAADHERYVRQRAELIGSVLGPSVRTAVADLGTGHAAASAPDIFGTLGLDGRQIDVAQSIERHVELVDRWQPDLLFTMPMILERLLGAGLRHSPERIVVLGDLAPRPWRTAISARVGTPAERILDVFGSIEVGAIAYSDDRLGGYLFHEHIVPEASSPTEPRDDDGQLLILTSLARDSFPAVRYVSGDIVRGLRPVEVEGRRRWFYDVHLGRQGAEVKHGEMLSAYTIGQEMARVAPGVAWSLRREGLEAVIDIDASAATPALAAAIVDAVRGAHPAVDRMVASGLVGDLRVAPCNFADGTAKRRIRTG